MTEKPPIKIRELQDAWKTFDTKWETTCAYHQQQANAILKAQTSELFSGEEAMSELRKISIEREQCHECN